MRPRISLRPLVRPSVRLFEKWTINDLGSAGRGREKDEKEGGTGKKERRGGWSDEVERATRRVKK